MKLIQLLSLFTLCVSLATLAQGQQKTGFVSTEAIIALLPVTQKANDELREMQTKFLTQGQAMNDEMKAKYDALVAQNQAGTLSDNMKQLGQQEMAQLQQDLNDHQQQMQDTLTKRRTVLFKPILNQVQETIQKVAKAQNYDVVFDIQEAGILYATNDFNLTKAVLLDLGVDPATIAKVEEK
ncbi:MAG: OmpH family outer membrane protein [Verrucomicrobia bacterium]|nr:OmpH family outer membrane protein [Verrucomicrobiota bacterium]MDA1066931.1 OmpH family outer membrane protein [Verrucomicrobiota bacterium]